MRLASPGINHVEPNIVNILIYDNTTFVDPASEVTPSVAGQDERRCDASFLDYH